MTTCPHCMGAGCLHCREKRAEAHSLRRRSSLTDADRIALGLFVRPPRVRPERARVPAPAPAPAAFNAVLPASYACPG